MSTCAVTPEDYKFFDLFATYLWPSRSAKTLRHYRDEVADGNLQIETLLENALAKASGGQYKRIAIPKMDFCDQSDAKKTTSSFRNNNTFTDQWTNSFKVSGVSNKVGLLRVVGYSREQDGFYFFAIPHSAYGGIKAVEIILDTSYGECTPIGKPKGKWAKYIVPSFKDLAMITEQQAKLLPNRKSFDFPATKVVSLQDNIFASISYNMTQTNLPILANLPVIPTIQSMDVYLDI